MKKYVTGAKRLQIIEDYLAGHENAEYEVQPSKVEGKYLVRPRKQPLEIPENVPSDNDNVDLEDAHENVTEADDKSEDPHESVTAHVANEPSQVKAATTSKARATKQGTTSKPPKLNMNAAYNAYDPTTSIEILNQLKLLGAELRADREAKQQKKLIKHTVRDQMYKNQYTNSKQQYVDEHSEDDDEEPIQPVKQIITMPKYQRRRVNLLPK